MPGQCATHLSLTAPHLQATTAPASAGAAGGSAWLLVVVTVVVHPWHVVVSVVVLVGMVRLADDGEGRLLWRKHANFGTGPLLRRSRRNAATNRIFFPGEIHLF